MIRVILLAAVFFLLFNSQNAMALSCVEMPPIDVVFEKYDGVIIGQVVEIIRDKKGKQIKLKVVKSYKGIQEEQVLADESITWGTSEVGQEYLYFLRQTESGWENPLCAPMKNVVDATNELTYLQAKEIQLRTADTPTDPPSDNITNIEPMVSDDVIDDPLTSTNWTVILLITGGLLVLLGVAVIRLMKRSK